MNKFNIPNPSGGHMLKAHDLNFIYQSLQEGITGAAHALGNAILYGCTIDLVNNVLTEGFVAIAGEIYYSPQASLFPDYRFSVVETVNPLSPRVMDDASSKNIHFTRRVELVNTGGTHPLTMADYRDIWLEYGNTGDLAYPVRLYSSNVVRPASSLLRPLRIKKSGRNLIIQGSVKVVAFANGTILFELPEECRNGKFNMITVSASTGETSGYSHWMNVWWYANGIASVDSGSFTTADDTIVLHFNHVIALL